MRSVILGVLLAACTVQAGMRAAPAAQPDDLVELSRRGKQAMATGKYEEAIGIFSELVRALPEEHALRMNLGIAYYMAGRHEQAIRELEAASTRQRNLGPALFVLGAAYLRTGVPQRAVAPLEEVLATEPRNARALHMLADALLLSDRCEEAIARYMALADLEPRNPKAWYGLGRCYEALASGVFQTLLEMDPGSPYASLLRAQALFQQKRYARALPLYRDALARLPDPLAIHQDVAAIYHETGHPEWAEREEAKARQAPSADCTAPSAACLFEAGRYSDVVAAVRTDRSAAALYWRSRAYGRLATEAFFRLGELPPSAEMHQVTAEALRAAGRAKEAADEWREALRYDPADLTLRRGLAESLFLARDFEAAKALLQELVKQQPRSARVHLMYGATLLELHEPQEALPSLRRATQLDPELVRARAFLGRAYLISGQADAAIPHLEAASKHDEDGEIHYQLATAYRRTGNGLRADETLKRYEQIRAAMDAARHEQEQIAEITPP